MSWFASASLKGSESAEVHNVAKAAALPGFPLGVSRQVHTPVADTMEMSDPRASSRDQKDKRENKTDDE